MPGDGVKQRKTKTAAAVQNNGENRDSHQTCNSSVRKDEEKNAKFYEVEEKYNHLYEKAADLLALQKKFSAISEKLEASEDHLKGTLSSVAMLRQLQHDVTSLNSIITAMEEDQQASSRRLQSVNEHFLNVTETWQGGLATVTEDLTALRSESRLVHGRVTEHVNEAEERLRSLTKRLEELEDSTRRNVRALEHTEEEDAKRVQNHLDWNTKQVVKLQEQFTLLSKKDVELEEKLVETEPQAKQCIAELPIVEEAVRSILRLGADLSGTERRLEELTLQVVNTEDSMLKALVEILELRRTIDKLQVDNSVMNVRNEIDVLMDNVKELIRQQSKQELEEKAEQDDEKLFKQLSDGLKHLDSTTFPKSTGNEEE
ncbi:inhibitor of nuclear factor kappa-B kinase-interacting protein isoform X3 [Trichomycterus rosablanca]|uniref:inhibitor of nuclear factor kappa-B kinase-interacting protein isoform X3 n=1 Tax=Trichomycterus rosablanca TaxID=2290929 RepID=UPI002F352CFC